MLCAISLRSTPVSTLKPVSDSKCAADSPVEKLARDALAEITQQVVHGRVRAAQGGNSRAVVR